MIGFLLACASIPLGIIGLKKRREDPRVSGRVHAWIGIGCGGLSFVVWGSVLVLLLIGALQG